MSYFSIRYLELNSGCDKIKTTLIEKGSLAEAIEFAPTYMKGRKGTLAGSAPAFDIVNVVQT